MKRINSLDGYTGDNGPLVFVIMDGIGIGPEDGSNGVTSSYTPVLNEFMQEKLVVQLKAHGTAVGLPTEGDMGNSEVGHNALGAGRIFSQGAKLVNEALKTGSVFEGQTWQALMETVSKGTTLHFIGLVSDGNVHSHILQLYNLLDRCAAENVGRVRVHVLLDGRDVSPKSALDYLEPLEQKLAKLCENGMDYRIASGGGRMVTTMDRYGANWAVVEKGWKAHVLGEARAFSSAVEAVETYYREDSDMADQYMDSFVIVDEEGPVGTIEDGDGVVFFNFRGDRAIEISRAFEDNEFQPFDRQRVPDVFYAGMMQYDGDALIPRNFLVQPPAITNTLGEYLCDVGVSSYAVSETQKFGHVTYFWNGNRSGYINQDLEKYEEIESDRIAFDLRPWMKAAEITDKVLACIKEGKHRFIRLNYANGDMVGHTGNVAAIRIAVETVDLCLARLREGVKAAGGILVVTADHGNADCMWKEKGGQRTPMVAHTLNPVPFVVKDYGDSNGFMLTDVVGPGLSNVAATLCVLLGFEPPVEYDRPLVRLV